MPTFQHCSDMLIEFFWGSRIGDNRIRVGLTQDNSWRGDSGLFALAHSAFLLLRLYALVSCWLHKGILKLSWKPKIKLLWRALILVSWWVVSRCIYLSWAMKPCSFRPGGLHSCRACATVWASGACGFSRGAILGASDRAGGYHMYGLSRGSVHAW